MCVYVKLFSGKHPAASWRLHPSSSCCFYPVHSASLICGRLLHLLCHICDTERRLPSQLHESITRISLPSLVCMCFIWSCAVSPVTSVSGGLPPPHPSHLLCHVYVPRQPCVNKQRLLSSLPRSLLFTAGLFYLLSIFCSACPALLSRPWRPSLCPAPYRAHHPSYLLLLPWSHLGLCLLFFVLRGASASSDGDAFVSQSGCRAEY